MNLKPFENRITHVCYDYLRAGYYHPEASPSSKVDEKKSPRVFKNVYAKIKPKKIQEKVKNLKKKYLKNSSSVHKLYNKKKI